MCQKEFFDKYDLKKHKARKHSELQTMVECEICQKEMREDLFKSHVANHYKDKELVSCEICGKEMRKESLSQHLKIHDENREKVNCEICSTQVFKECLREHIKIHQKIPEKIKLVTTFSFPFQNRFRNIGNKMERTQISRITERNGTERTAFQHFT